MKKRERRQPGVIPDLAYLHWERTGQPPAGPYSVSKVIYLKSYYNDPKFSDRYVCANSADPR